MRILHILDHSIPLHSGYTFRTRAILEQQRKLGWETDHITSPKHNLVAKPTMDEEEVDGFHFFRTAPSKGLFSRLPVLNQWTIVRELEVRLNEAIEQFKPDILHAHSPALNGVAAVRAGARFGLPVVYEVRAFWEDAAVDHGTTREGSLRYRLTRSMETWVLRRAQRVTTICEGLRRDILERGLPEDKVTVIPNAVDIEKFSVSREKDEVLLQELGLKDKPVVGFIGSFYAYEGLALLLKAIPTLTQQIPDIKVLLVGGGDQLESLQHLVTELDIQDSVVLTGRVPHDQVQRYYDLVDILVYPRMPMRLTELVTPLKPLEAMAQGRLVVASDVGGHRELIQDGKTGTLFKAGDVTALSEALLGLLNDRSQWLVRQQEARQFVEVERSWPVSVARYQSVYEGLA
jgi:PEP-CTERM/exosortase A-associated glycosyltransferase